MGMTAARTWAHSIDMRLPFQTSPGQYDPKGLKVRAGAVGGAGSTAPAHSAACLPACLVPACRSRPPPVSRAAAAASRRVPPALVQRPPLPPPPPPPKQQQQQQQQQQQRLRPVQSTTPGPAAAIASRRRVLRPNPQALDYVIDSAARHGMTLILSFIDNWKYYNGVSQVRPRHQGSSEEGARRSRGRGLAAGELARRGSLSTGRGSGRARPA
jgi:hypothetical protein